MCLATGGLLARPRAHACSLERSSGHPQQARRRRRSADAEALSALLADAGLEARINTFARGEEIRKLARRALRERPPVLVAAGGDGTVSAVADVVRGSGTALGVIPVGTLNHFAKDLGIPLDPAEAVRVSRRAGASAWTWAR